MCYFLATREDCLSPYRLSIVANDRAVIDAAGAKYKSEQEARAPRHTYVSECDDQEHAETIVSRLNRR